MTESLGLREGAARLGIEISADQGAQLTAFATLIRRWSAAYNLVSRDDIERLETRHLLDCLAFAPHLRGCSVADLGSGAGLPGIPLAIVRPAVKVTLLDRSDKRLRFARHAALELGLSNVVAVVTTEIARFRPATPFDTVVARALAGPAQTWRLVRPLLGPGGRAVWATALGVAPPRVAGIDATAFPVTLPGVERRHQLIVVDRAAARSGEPEHV